MSFPAGGRSIVMRWWDEPGRRRSHKVKETDLELSDGRTLHIYDTSGDGADARLAVFWHHGTPNIGPPPEPLLPAAAQRGIR